MARSVAHRRVQWCNRNVEWTAIAADEGGEPTPRNTVWSYELDGMHYFGFVFDPAEAETTTRQRALNWLNRYHLIIRREHLAIEPLSSLH